MVKVFRRNQRQSREAAGLWDRPWALNLMADTLYAVGILALSYAAGVAVLRMPLLPVKELEVLSPLNRVDPKHLEYALRANLKGNFFTLRLDEVRAAFEQVPWVRRAEVRRRWPDGLELEVQEYEAAAQWFEADGDNSRLVSQEGEVFAARSREPLPLFKGPDGSAATMLARYQILQEQLAPVGRSPEELVLTPRQAWKVRLDDGLSLEFGRDEGLDSFSERLTRFVSVQQEMAKKFRDPVAVVDLRYPNGFAVKTSSRGNKTDKQGKK